MLSHFEKERLSNGVYGRTRDGKKCKIIQNFSEYYSDNALLLADGNKKPKPYAGIVFADSDDKDCWLIIDTLWYTEDFTVFDNGVESPFDIVDFWLSAPEFDLEEALKGKPVQLACGDKAYVLKKITNPMFDGEVVVGYGEEISSGKQYFLMWNEFGEIASCYDADSRIIGMWDNPI